MECKTSLSQLLREDLTRLFQDLMLFFTHKPAVSIQKCRSQQKTLDRSRWELIVNKETENFFLLKELLHSLLINSSCKDLLTASSYSSLIQEIEISKEKRNVKVRKSLLMHVNSLYKYLKS